MDNARLTALRARMAETGIDAYIVPTADDHESEYVGEHYKARAFCTGFTGSAGICAVTQEDAVLWTDGRYFIQAARQRLPAPAQRGARRPDAAGIPGVGAARGRVPGL